MSLAPRGFPDLVERRREPELMDGYGLDRRLHEQALDALGRVNRVSLTAARAWSEIERLARAGEPPVRVLDVACGGGDVLIDLAKRARAGRVEVDLLGCDVSPVALERAHERARALGVNAGDAGPALRFEQRDVLDEGLPPGYRLVLCSLFLHHLSDEGAVRLLRMLAAASGSVLLVQDLRRTPAGYALAWLGLHLLTRSVVARIDGLVSVRAAFTLPEARALAREAGLEDVEVFPCWPQRFALRWTRRGP